MISLVENRVFSWPSRWIDTPIARSLFRSNRSTRVSVKTSRCSFVRPDIEIRCVSADVDHGIHRRTSSQCFAPRQIDPSIPQTRLRLTREVPVVLGLEQLRKGYGHTDLGSVVGPSRFHQRHTDFRILAESRR